MQVVMVMVAVMVMVVVVVMVMVVMTPATPRRRALHWRRRRVRFCA